MNHNGRKVQDSQRNNISFDTFCFWIITIDILFLPYLSFMTVSLSIFLVVIWLVCNCKKILHDKEGVIYILMLVIMLFSTIICLFYTGKLRFETSFSTSVKRFFQYVICFGNYFFYKQYFSRKKVELNKIMFWAIIYIAIFAVIYKSFPYEYAQIKILINPSDNHTRRFLSNMVPYRFNYFWTDPNNISYLVAGISAWFIIQDKGGWTKKIIVLISSIFIAFCTVSNGGLIILVGMFCGLLGITLVKFIKKGMIRKHFFTIGIILIGIVIIFLFTPLEEYIYKNYILMFIERIGIYSSTQNISGGRFEDLKLSLQYLNPLFLIIGVGKEGIVTEIGHIYWIGMYGFPAYIMFMWLMFKKASYQTIKKYIWVVPFFVAFTMNIAIGEYKWMAIYLMLLAYSRTNYEN